jgi:hypothetical protein
VHQHGEHKPDRSEPEASDEPIECPVPRPGVLRGSSGGSNRPTPGPEPPERLHAPSRRNRIHHTARRIVQQPLHLPPPLGHDDGVRPLPADVGVASQRSAVTTSNPATHPVRSMHRPNYFATARRARPKRNPLLPHSAPTTTPVETADRAHSYPHTAQRQTAQQPRPAASASSTDPHRRLGQPSRPQGHRSFAPPELSAKGQPQPRQTSPSPKAPRRPRHTTPAPPTPPTRRYPRRAPPPPRQKTPQPL